MSTSSSVLAEIMFQAAVAVGHHAKSTPLAAIREGCIRTFGAETKESYQAYYAARQVYTLCMGIAWDPRLFHMDGPSWRQWLSKQGRAEMVTVFLFIHEFILSEMSGDKGTIHQIVTSCNSNQTVVHSTSGVV